MTDDGSKGFESLYARLDKMEQMLSAEISLSPEARATILEARAKTLAEDRKKEATETLEVFIFQVGGERYAVRLSEMEVVVEVKTLARLPGAPRHVLGALNVSGTVIAVLDLRQLLNLSGMSDLTRVVVVRGPSGPFGLAVEAIEGRHESPVSKHSSRLEGPFSSVTAEWLAVLDLARLEECGT